jgi:RHS repeat-associated protein
LSPPAQAQTITYFYDNDSGCGTSQPNRIGRLCAVSDPSGSQTSEILEYDQRGNLTKTTKVIAGTTYSLQWGAYDSLNRVGTLTYPDNEQVQYSYNTQGLLNQVRSITYSSDYVTNLDYNPRSQVTKRVLGNGLTTDYTYSDATHACPRNNNFRPCTIITSTLQNLTYAYDNVGNVAGITDSVGVATQTFGYDALNRLTSASSATAPSYSHTYGYNAIGNLTSAAGQTYTYPSAGAPRPHAPTSDGISSYGYNANGDMITKVTGSVTRSLTWDGENHLSQIADNGTILATFAYDYAGERVKKTGNGTTTYYVEDLYECVTSSGTACKKYIFVGDDRVAMRPVAGSAGEVYYYLTDHLGSTSVVTDKCGGKVQTTIYYPYGTKRVENVYSGCTALDNRIRHYFTGEELDAETGLYDYGARYYDPVLARFISPDPIEPEYSNPQTLNRYSYALNNPLRYTDPTGLYVEGRDAGGNRIIIDNAGRLLVIQPSGQYFIAYPPLPTGEVITFNSDHGFRVYSGGEQVAPSGMARTFIVLVATGGEDPGGLNPNVSAPPFDVPFTPGGGLGTTGGKSLDDLSRSGQLKDPSDKSGQRTRAGRALEKHGGRQGSAFPQAKGNPAQINQQGQGVLDDILTSPGSTMKSGNRFGGFDVIAPGGRGARFDANGNFRGFIEPNRK